MIDKLILFTLMCICRSNLPQPAANKGSYSQVGFSYGGNGKEESQISDDDDDNDNEEDEDDEDDEDFNSDDSNDEGMEIIAKEFGVKRYGWLVYMDKKAKEEEKRQKEMIKGDPAIVSGTFLVRMNNIFVKSIVQMFFNGIYNLCRES